MLSIISTPRWHELQAEMFRCLMQPILKNWLCRMSRTWWPPPNRYYTSRIAGMPTNVLMPALSPTMEKGKLAKWLKKEGDQVRSGDVIAEIETDKATMEVEAVDEGKLGKIIVPEGTDDVAVNTPIAVILGEGEDDSAIKIQSQAPAARVPEQAAPPSQGSSGPAADNRAASPAPATGLMPHKGNCRVFSSPLARRLAKQRNLNIALV